MLGNTDTVRQYAYRELFNCDISSEQLHIFRDCLNHNYPMGNERFKSDIEAALNRKLGYLKPGRPWPSKNE